MKTILGVLFLSFSFAASTVAQDQSAIASSMKACGPKETMFDAKRDTTQHPAPQPDPDKALVYVIQDLGADCSHCVLTRVAMDGAWIGANRDSRSYIFFAAAPGEHHLCVNWQSWVEEINRKYAFADFRTEAGHTYYFRMRSTYFFDLEPVNTDEGKYLVASSALSVSNPKNTK